jgi:hypothetical protein
MIWMELRCDSQESPQCWSWRNEGPKDPSSHQHVVRTARFLERAAAKMGWTVMDGHWLCPACRKEERP